MSKYLSVKYLLISKKHWHPRLIRSKRWFLWDPFGGLGDGGWYPQTMSKYFSVKYPLISKNTGTLSQAVQKFDFWGAFGGVRYPQIMSKILSVKYLLISNKTEALAWSVQKIDFLVPRFGGVPKGVTQNISGDKIAFAAQQLCTKIKFWSFVV